MLEMILNARGEVFSRWEIEYGKSDKTMKYGGGGEGGGGSFGI